MIRTVIDIARWLMALRPTPFAPTAEIVQLSDAGLQAGIAGRKLRLEIDQAAQLQESNPDRLQD